MSPGTDSSLLGEAWLASYSSADGPSSHRVWLFEALEEQGGLPRRAPPCDRRLSRCTEAEPLARRGRRTTCRKSFTTYTGTKLSLKLQNPVIAAGEADFASRRASPGGQVRHDSERRPLAASSRPPAGPDGPTSPADPDPPRRDLGVAGKIELLTNRLKQPKVNTRVVTTATGATRGQQDPPKLDEINWGD